MIYNTMIYSYRNFLLAGLVSICILVPLKHSRSDIIVESSGAFSSWGSVGTDIVGQTFVADGSVEILETISFFYRDSNTHLADPSGTLDLFQGAGYGGALLDSQTKTLTKGIGNHWEDFDFSGNDLIAGQVYTWRLTGGPGAGGYGEGQPYADGARLDSNGDPTNGDLAFRIIGSPVPEPGSLVIISFAVLGLSARRRLRN